MGRRKQSGLDAIASMPWPVGFLLGIAAYWFIRHGIGAYFAAQGSPLSKGFSGEIFAPLAWGADRLLGGCRCFGTAAAPT